MAQTKTIQLLRSSALYDSKEAAKSAIIARTAKDGEVILARYQVGTVGGSGEDADNIVAKSLLGIYHKNPDLTPSSGTVKAGWTIIEDASDVNAILEGLDANTNVTKSGSGAQATYAGTDDSLVIIGVMQENGQVTSVSSELSSVKLASVSGTAAAIAAEDTLGTALGKLQAQIEAMDSTVTTAVNSGDVITSISETNGVVTANKANLTDVLMTGYAADTTQTGAIAATDTLEQAFNKVENSLGAITVKSTDKTVTITNNSGKDLSVNIDGTTLVKDSSTGVISADLTVVKLNSTEVTALSDANVKEAYKLIYSTDSNRTAIGDVVKVYKDSALQEIYLGDASDTVNSSTGAVTKYAYQLISDPTTKITADAYDELTSEQKALYEPVAGQSLNYVYQLADGSYSLVKIDVSDFLAESEFGDGLQVVSGVVSVKKDANSGKVRTAATPNGVTPGASGDTGLVDVLTVSSNGVKVDNIQAAIDYAVQNSSTSLAVTAEGDDYVSASVDAATNNKHVVVATNVQDLTATAGTPGVYNSSTGAQTTAPVAGTLSGVADSLGDASDIATKVKTYVDGAIAIEAARSDAKNKADIVALDGEALASTAPTAVTYSGTNSDEFQVLTRVNEVDGVVQTVDATANSTGSKSVTLKKVAATGAAADVSIADSGNLITATTVEGALQEIAGKANESLQSISAGNNAITVGTEDANHNQTVGLAISANSAKQANGTTGMLTIESDGLSLSDTWDCGTF